MFFVRFALVTLSTLLIGCGSLDTNLEKQEGAATTIYDTAFETQQAREKRSISWEESLELMFANNLELKRSRISVENAYENRAQIYWNLVPSLRASTSLRKALGELGRISSEDVNFSLFSSVNVPGLVSLRSRHYATSLAIVRAEIAHELKCRDLVIRLRELFLRYAIFEQRERAAAYNRMLREAEGQSLDTLTDVSPALIDAEQEEYRLRSAEDQLQESISRLLGDYTYLWKLQAETVPELSYAANPLDLQDTDAIGILLREDLAANLEAIRLSEISALISFFPDLSSGVSAPPLVSVSRGISREFRAEDIRVRMSSSLSLDTRGQKRRRLKDVRQRMELQHEEIKVRVQSEIRRAVLAQEELSLLEQDIRLVDLRSRINMRSRNWEGSSQGLSAAIEKRQSLAEQAASLRLRKAQIENGFWLLDDAWWERDDNFKRLLQRSMERF
jgi:hypothetical protein